LSRTEKSARRPAVFLDRDGVINIDHGYTYRPEDLIFTPTAVEGIKAFNRAGYYVLIVTNQSGVARGLYTTQDVERFHAYMQHELHLQGAHVDGFYYCAFHPEGIIPQYAIDHEDRKPNPGMLLRAMRDWPIEIERSVMIGDKDTDMQVAARAGVKGLLVDANVCDLAAEAQKFLEQFAKQ
jgi:D-glycero-D-manno-heptose 1,7-bisphosphate phosphatase